MTNIKQLIKDFNVDNKEDLANLFLYTYEYSFTIEEIFPNPNGAIKVKDDYLRELSGIEDLERLWYGLYFKFILYYTKNSNTKLLDNSLKKSIKQLSSINIDFLRKQYSEINELSSTNELIERPIISIQYSDNDIYKKISKFKDKILNFISENSKIFSQKRCDSFNVINDNVITKYIKKEEVFLELWFISLYDGILSEVFPKLINISNTNINGSNSATLIDTLVKMTNEEAENLTNEELNEIVKKTIEVNDKEISDLLNYGNNFENENNIVLGITNNFVEAITQSKKGQNILRNFINPINKQIIEDILFSAE